MRLLLTGKEAFAYTSRTASLTQFVSLAIAGSMLIAIGAHIAVPLPFTPVPMTLQTFAVILVGMLLGPVGGFAAAALYLFEGLAGAPVFSLHGVGGILQLLGPTGGYLMSYPLAAALAGALYSRRTYVRGVVAGLASTTLMLVCGAVWFALITHLSAHTVWIATLAPFLAGEAVKILAAAGIATALPRMGR